MMKGNKWMVMGVAIDHSIAGARPKRSRRGAELAFTYQGDALGQSG